MIIKIRLRTFGKKYEVRKASSVNIGGNKYLPFDEPIPYKDLFISPIKLKDSYDVQNILNILQIDKNNLGHVEFISMSKLRFVLIMICDSEEYQTELYNLLYKSLSIPLDNIIEIYIDDYKEYLLLIIFFYLYF